MVDYPKAIRVALAKKGMRQYQLADKLGVTRATVGLYMKGNKLSTKRLTQIAEVMEMKVSELVALGEQ